MNDGEFLREGLVELYEHQSGPVFVYKDWRTPNEHKSSVRGIKANPGMFAFLDQIDVSPGDVLQQEGSRSFWRVKLVEDEIVAGTFVQLKVSVGNIDAPPPIPQSVSFHAPVIGGIQIGNVNSSQNVSVSIAPGLQQNLIRLRALLSELNIAELDKDDAVEAFGKLESLAQRPKTPEVVSKMKEKLGIITNIFSIAKNGAELAAPYLAAIAKWIDG